MNRYCTLPLTILSLCLFSSSSYAMHTGPGPLIRDADVAMIQAMEKTNHTNQFAEDKKYFFQDLHPEVAVEEKTIDEILNMPATLGGLISVDALLESDIKSGKVLGLSDAEYLLKLRSGQGVPNNRAIPTPKDWTYVAEHSRAGGTQ